MMFIDLLDGCWYGDQNTWNTIPVSGQKITLNNQAIENRIVKQNKLNKTETELEMIEQKRMNVKRGNWQGDE